jgi:ribosome-binding factor A
MRKFEANRNHKPGQVGLPNMESTRQLKFARLIQKELSEIFQREARELTANYLITITLVRVSPDLGIAKIYLSFLPDKNKGQQLELIQTNAKNVRQALGARLRQSVRIIPELQFYIDDTEEEAAKINQLLSSIVIPPAEG